MRVKIQHYPTHIPGAPGTIEDNPIQYHYMLSEEASSRYRMPIAFVQNEIGDHSTLDVACGNGGLFKYLSESNRTRYIGIDKNENMIGSCQRRFLTDLKFRVGSAPESIKQFAGQFDHVYLGGLIGFSTTASGKKADDVSILTASANAVSKGGFMSLAQSFCYSDSEYGFFSQQASRHKDNLRLIQEFINSYDRKVSEVYNDHVDLFGITEVIKKQAVKPYWFTEEESRWGPFFGNKMGTNFYIFKIS